MEENSNSDYMDEMLEYDAVVEDDCDISSDIADAEEFLTDEEDHSATDSNPYEAALGRLSRMNLECRPQDINDDKAISDFRREWLWMFEVEWQELHSAIFCWPH